MSTCVGKWVASVRAARSMSPASTRRPASIGSPRHREAERLGVADQPVEALVDPPAAGRVEPAHVVAQVGRGERLAASRDELAQRGRNPVAPALGEPAPAGGRALLRPFRAEVGLEPERAVAHDQAGLVGPVEEAGQFLERDAARLGEALGVGQCEPALRELAGRLAAELGQQLGGRRDGGVGGLGGAPLEQAAVDVVDAHEHRRGGCGELGRGRDVARGMRGEPSRHRGGHVHAPLAGDDEQGGAEFAQEGRRGIRQLGGCPERHELGLHRVGRRVAVLIGDGRRRREHGEVAPIEPAHARGRRSRGRGAPRRGRRGRGLRSHRTRASAAPTRVRVAAARGVVRRARASAAVSSTRPARRGLGERRSR